MIRYDLASAGILLVVGLLFAFESRRLQTGTLHAPGPGLFPFALGVLLCLVALGLAARARWMREAREAEPARWRRIVLPLALLVIYALLLETAGFPLASTLLMLCFFRGVDPIPWPYAVGGSLVAGVGSYLVFKHLLAVQLPAGLLLPF